MDDFALHGLVQSGAVGDGSSAGGFSVRTSGGFVHGLAEGLQTGLDGLVARRIPGGFAGGFDC